MASTMPNSVSVLMENPNAASTPKVPSSTTGTAIAGISVARQVLQEDEHHQEHQHDRLDQRLDHFLDRQPHEGRGVVGENAFRQPAGRTVAARATFALTASAVASALAPGASWTAMPGGGLPL